MELNPIYSFVRSRMMEGTFPGAPETGASLLTAMRVSRIYGAMPMQVWSQGGKPWPPQLPDRATEHQAKAYRIRSYHRIVDLEGARFALARARPFGTVVPITPQWMNADRGRIEMPNSEFSNLHCVCLVGYDDEAQALKFANNWGRDWGDDGFGYLPYDYWTRFHMDSWLMDGFGEMPWLRLHPPRAEGKIEVSWRRTIEGVGFVVGWEMLAGDASTDDLGWAFAVLVGNNLNIQELYVRPDYRRQGIGRFLMTRLEGVAQACGAVPRYWLSHVDSSALGQDKLDIAHAFGYRVEESGVTWAAKLIVPRTQAYEVRPQSPSARFGSCAAGHLGMDAIYGAVPFLWELGRGQ